ncbi:hypothetical protein G5B31_19265 [Rhodobacter sp. SGA-6-6]|uniref:hypothetical protein n=1 Tax=Rhodobacter sp. SGA-6-6 TaxID=2710882 RepID=UPI0013ECDAD1|nr:hypothetical protein [Rhodobacter sp. SGA-6-6]NGM47677.1 hypothetical protein [Rhodobacter sp. SGA-6-6]
MTPAAASIVFGPAGPVLRPGPQLPVEAMLLGKPVAEAAGMLPRLFNLCRVAQGMAAFLSLGLPAAGDLRAEVIRDHLVKLCVLLPRALGMAPLPLPADPASLLGRRGLPADGDPAGWDSPLAPLAGRIAASFAPGEARSAALPPPPSPLAEGAFENSAAGRQAGQPGLKAIEAVCGRGPLWRFFGLVADLEAAIQGRLPAPTVADGIARVPAARGAYGLRIAQAGGIVTGLHRRTPTDHLLAPGGALIGALAALPAAKRALAPLVVALHDPCIPVTIGEAQDA